MERSLQRTQGIVVAGKTAQAQSLAHLPGVDRIGLSETEKRQVNEINVTP